MKKVPWETEAWSLSQQSAADYLQRNLDTWCPEPQAIIGKTCLAYLAFDVFSEGYCDTKDKPELRLEEYPFYGYAAQHWAGHIFGVQDLPESVVCSFLLDKNKVEFARQAVRVATRTVPYTRTTRT